MSGTERSEGPLMWRERSDRGGSTKGRERVQSEQERSDFQPVRRALCDLQPVWRALCDLQPVRRAL